ncbi:MAG: 2-dehydropantoate 2-reductase [Deinococcota bacterium]|nr:2-dehydropantoate 2-reductase [Deinococcota bacterium]
MKLLIWGGGAIGGTLAGYFSRAGHDVTLVDIASEHIEAVRAHGLSVEGPIDTFTATVAADTPSSLGGSFDTILLCVKAQATEAACHMLLPHLTPAGVVVSIQNGLNELTIASIVGEARTLGAFVNFGADYLSPGRIHYGGRGAVVLGELDGRASKRLEKLHDVFLTFDERAIQSDNIWGYLWSKLAVGAMLFATALTNEAIADAFALPRYRDLFVAIAGEVLAVAQARGVTPEPFDGFDPRAFMPGTPREISYRSLGDMVAFNRRSAKTHSGIWRDLAIRKRETEVDAQLATVIPLGREVGLELPVTREIVRLIHDVEARRLPLSLDNLVMLERVLEVHVRGAG